MNQYVTAKAINIFFLTAIIMLLFFACTKSYFSTKIAIALSILLSIVTTSLIAKIKSRRLTKLGLEKKDLKHAESCITKFLWTPPLVVLMFFQIITEGKIINDSIIKNDKTIIPLFKNKTISIDEIVKAREIAKKNKTQTLIIFGNSFDIEITAKANEQFFDGTSTYAYLKQKQIFPKCNNIIVKKRKNIVKTMFSRKNFWKYIGLSFVFLIANFFVPQNILYLIFAVISIAFATICLVQPKQKVEQNFNF